MMVNAMSQTKTLLYTVYSVYFFCGLALCFENVFLPEFKELFGLTYTEQMYTMFAKNIPFIFLSVGIGFLTNRIGFKNCLTIALFLFALGSWLIVPGLTSGNYSLVLLAFFIIGVGFNFELVAGNPLLSMLGSESGSSSRLNIGNALGAIAQIIAPLFLTFFIPKSAAGVAERMPYIQWVFIITSIVLALFALITIFMKRENVAYTNLAESSNSQMNQDSLWTNSKVLLGFVSIFLVIGIEAGLFGLYRNYLEDDVYHLLCCFCTWAIDWFICSKKDQPLGHSCILPDLINDTGYADCFFFRMGSHRIHYSYRILYFHIFSNAICHRH
jgi:FHS family L-fucose permease-like MFS transporter